MWPYKFPGMPPIELEEQIDKLERRYRWVRPYTLLRFEVQVAEHCNIHCKDCDHYAPLAGEEFLDVAQYERDCARLSELFDSEVKFVHLLGGEPLLNPRLPEIIRITREAFRVGKIMVVTNGLLLPSMGDDFWNACRDCRVMLSPTQYPVKFDYDKWGEYAKERGVIWTPFSLGNVDKDTEVKRMHRALIDPTGRYVVERNYYHCYAANACLTLRNGRLFTCQRAAHAHHLKKYFDLDINLSKRDSVDIYEVKDAYELMEKVNRPIPFCKYCNLASCYYEEDWGASRSDRYEWIDFVWAPADIQYLKEAPSVYVYGAGDMARKAVGRIQENGVAVSAVLLGDGDEAPGWAQDVPVMSARAAEPEGGVCLLAVDNEEKTRAGRAVSRCGFKQIIPLYVC